MAVSHSERSSPEFLRYKDTSVHFIYSFAWDPHRAAWGVVKADLETKGWQQRRLHERTLDSGCASQNGPTYQPSLVAEHFVLERTGVISKRAIVRAPTEAYEGHSLPRCVEIPVRLSYTIRVLDNGGGICTLVAHIAQADASFEAIHMILRLAANVDRTGGTEAEAQQHKHLTASFVGLDMARDADCDASLVPTNSTHSVSFRDGYFTLHDLFRRLLTDRDLPWAPSSGADFWCDSEVLDTSDLHQDFQTPFVFTAAEIDRSGLDSLESNSAHIAEVASIVCKLTLDNRHIATDYRYLSEDYLEQALPARRKGGLANLCLDRRLFFTTSRRGAIALAESMVTIPAYFVVPSFLNLLEILRTRWHLSNVISARLDRIIAEIRTGSISKPEALLEQNYRWRAIFGAFLRDPTPFLFDGGSVTDIAEHAQRQQWLPQLAQDTERKLACLDQLIRDYVSLERWKIIRTAEQAADEAQE